MKTKHDTNSNEPRLTEIGTDEIKFFVRRSRSPGAFARLKQSIKELGLKKPIHVRDISDWPSSDRRRPDGGLYKYELICGQGRLQAFRELDLTRIPAMVIDVPEQEIVGRFLAENVMRRSLTWYEKAQLVSQDVEKGFDIEEIKSKYFITTGHVYKYLRILRQASTKLLSDSEIEKLSMNEAEELTSLDAKEQEIVIEVLKEDQLGSHQLRSLVKKTKELRQNGKVSKQVLRSSLRDLDKSLKEMRTRLKLKRLHWSLGPHNLKKLLEVPEFKVALEEEEVDYSEFLQVTNKAEAR